MGIKDAWKDAGKERKPGAGPPGEPTPARFEYAIETVKLVGDRAPTATLERLLANWSTAGWQLKSISDADVGGLLSREGFMLIFERPVADQPAPASAPDEITPSTWLPS